MKKTFHAHSIFICGFSLLAFLLLNSCTAQNLTFVNAPGSPDNCSSNPRGLETADFNKDGIVDLVIGNAYTNQLYVYLGVGNGSFTNAPGSPFVSGNGPISTAIADYNGDSNLDLAVANYNDGTVSIFLGAGNGSFTSAPGSPMAAGGFPYYISAADFNGDGKLDLVEVNQSSNSANVYLGAGNGTFTLASGSPFTTFSSPYCVVATDFNGDGKADIAIVSGGSNSVSVYLGNGNGTFTISVASPIPVGSFPRLAALYDYNNDGKIDMAVTNSNSNDVSILLGDGTGAFANAPGSPMATNGYPYSVNTADFNHDGKPDIAVTSGLNNNVAVYYGNNTGTFVQAPGSPFATGSDPQSMCIADFNGDGAPDLAIGNYAVDNATILINTLATFPPVASFTLSSGTGVCLGNSIAFTNTSNGSPTYYSWNFGDSGTSQAKDTVYTYTAAGTYTVSMTATNAIGSNTTSHVVQVYPKPVLSLGSATSVCPGKSTQLSASGAATYSWQPTAGLNTSTGSTVSAGPNSQTTYTVTGTSALGCKALDTVTVFVLPPPVITCLNDSVCKGQSAILTASGAVSYSWSPGVVLVNTAGDTVKSNSLTSVSYTVTGTGSNGCTQSLPVKVIVNPLPTLQIYGKDTLCIGSSTTLSATGASSYSWSPANQLNTSSGPVVTANPAAPITYTVTGISDYGCIGHASISIVTENMSEAAFVYSEACGGVVNFQQQSTQAASYVWDFGDGQISHLPSPAHSYAADGSYLVQLITNRGTSCQDSATALVQYIASGSKLIFPNVFSPNNDGTNDEFKISGFDYCGDYVLSIFDRWGKKMFETASPRVDFWNGKEPSGNPVTEGVYFYVISGPSYNKTGSLTLSR
jgi:gliding motility-associated-like protein